MIVLGIHDGHDAGACLLVDGKVVAFSAEERRTNIKNYMGVPTRSVMEVLKRTGVSPKNVDLVAVSGIIRTGRHGLQNDQKRTVMHSLSRLGQTSWGTAFGRFILAHTRKNKALDELLKTCGLDRQSIQFFDHHLCHAACAFYGRPWSEDTLVLTLDGAGDGLCATINKGTRQGLIPVVRVPKYHSIPAFMYSGITQYLGMKPYEHEYKVMGMAPYGHPERCIETFRSLFGVEGVNFRNKSGVTLHQTSDLFAKALKNKRFDDIAAACQRHFEEMMISWTKAAIQATGIRRIAAAGGAFLNVKANKLIRELDEVEDLFVFPAADDGGLPIGAAFLGHMNLCATRGLILPPKPIETMHLGIEHNAKTIEEAVKKSGFSYHATQNEGDEVAALLADGKIVARFQGREEVGPRALGNRSILADPRDLVVVRKLNFAIKQRDFWMPFAGSVLIDCAQDYLKGMNRVPEFMIEAFDTQPLGALNMPAAIHPFDQTIRPQVVSPHTGSYYEVIKAFHRRTGVGGVLNTSFNLHGSPIVGDPHIALETLRNSGLDALSIGPFIVRKSTS